MVDANRVVLMLMLSIRNEKIMDKIDYSKVSSNPKVIELIKDREKIEKQIRELEEMALVKYELEVLAISE